MTDTEKVNPHDANKDGETPFPPDCIELHIKSLHALADARKRDPNAQETLRCAASHIEQLARQLAEEREKRERAEAALFEFCPNIKYGLTPATRDAARDIIRTQVAETLRYISRAEHAEAQLRIAWEALEDIGFQSNSHAMMGIAQHALERMGNNNTREGR